MNTEKLNYAMQYVDDDLLMEFLATDDRLTAESTKTRQRTLKRFAAAACIVLFAFITGVTLHTLSNKPSIPSTEIAGFEGLEGLDAEAVPILLNDEKYQMFGDSISEQELLAQHGLPSDYSADTIGECLGYLEMAANKIDGRLCFTCTEEKTQFILYVYVNTDGDDYYILQSEGNYFLLVKDNLAH